MASGRLADGHGEWSGAALRGDLREIIRGDFEATPQPGPDSALTRVDKKEAPVKRRGKAAECRRGLGPDGDHTKVVGFELIAELGSVQELAGEQPFDALDPALFIRAPACPCLPRVFLR